jgi:ABC-type multidrug transport system ATPase subunit
MIHLSVQNLAKSYGQHAVFSNLSFETDPCILGVAGPNGSGKSTLLKCLAGILKPSGGTFNWRENEQSISGDRLKEILGFAAPYIQLYEELTVIENIRFIGEVRRNQLQIDPTEILEEAEASGFSNSFYGDLSTGQQQRVKLAASICHRPDILFLDEPGSNLDIRGKQLVERIVDRYRENSKMVILASNQTAELNLCDEIINLNPIEKEHNGIQ